MNKRMLGSFNKSTFIRAITITYLALILGGCATSKILGNRGDVPPATLAPSENANDIVSSMLENEALAIPMVNSEEITISQKNNLEGEFPGFPKVQAEAIEYKVKRGDSFWKIARMYGVGMKELAAFNKMDIKKSLNAGELLKIPLGGKLIPVDKLPKIKPRKSNKKVSSRAVAAKDGIYIVKPGDSLWVIARMHKTNINQLSEANSINKNSTLMVGQKLIIPGGAKAVKALKNGKSSPVSVRSGSSVPLSKADNDLLNDLIVDSTKDTGISGDVQNKSLDIATESFLPHTVKEGDSWNTLSEMYGVNINDLKKANPKITSETDPKVNSVVNIPEE